MLEDKLREALTFDDVLLVPSYSEVLPRDVEVKTRLCRGGALRRRPLPTRKRGRKLWPLRPRRCVRPNMFAS